MITSFFFFLLFANYVQQFIPNTSYFDEIITIVGIVMVFKFHHYNYFIGRNEKYIIRYIVLVLLIGIISTIHYHIQPKFAGVWRDALAIIKFPICYYAYYLYSRQLNASRILKRVLPWVKVILVIIFILGIATLIFRIPILYEGERYGLPLFTMGYTHNTFLVVTIYVLMATLIASGFRKNLFFIVIGGFCVLLSLRSKPLPPLVFLCIVGLIKTKGIRLSKIKVLIGTIAFIIVAYYAVESQLSMYLDWGEDAARGACYVFGADIANNSFPLGSGFCTFSSYLSGLYYSPLYYHYNMERLEGLSEDDFSYAADTFWPNIFAQYGWIGLFFYLRMIFYVVKSIHNRFLIMSDSWIAAMMLMIYMISAAFAEAIFTNDSCVIIAITLTLFIGKDYENSTSHIKLRGRWG